MIFVDNREIPTEILGVLGRLNLPYQLRQLDVCDYWIFGKPIPIQLSGQNGDVILYIIEHKSELDWIQSLITEHLNDQLIRMSQVAKHSAIVYVGSINRAIEKTGVNRTSVYSSLAGAFLRHAKDGEQGSISLIMLESTEDLGLLIQCVQKKLDDENGLIREPTLVLPQVAEKNNTNRRLIMTLMGCEGIGEAKARALLKKFGSISLMSEMEAKDLVCEGVGPVLGKALYNHLHSMYIESEQ
jgi:ERCC4-type nuclease